MEENITIEFVKEWIDKHNLTKDSFDRIMNDLIYNSGHNYIDNPYLRYWLIDNTYKFRDMLPVELNDNQQIVLEWLKEEKTNSNLTVFDCIYSFIYGNPKDLVTQIWSELNEKEEGQVLEAFGKWAQEQEEE
ncbi:hypothetical protein [Enterococcus dongliensis]|uniref:hypothetical protein n=1 Tax=Enterococcus dongliensis TaxID=2559925 RepID=UPI00288CABB2|nr:hypothetical protein [Enterococcus dongliensis]MDT2613824.1 hypothetical protein [Enterococcus dongliensis]